MGYCMHLQDADFHIRKENLSEALRGLKEVAGKGNPDNRNTTWAWVDMRQLGEATTLGDAMRACRWDLDFAEDGKVCGINFEGEKLGDDAQLFDALAPWVEDKSYVQMAGEDGELWRWTFDNGQMKEIDATISWEEPED